MLRAALFALLIATPATAQDWGDLGSVILPHLSNTGTSEATFWLPDTTDPTTAREAVAVVYEYIPGSAGNTSIALGHFARGATGWEFTGSLSEVFGQTPRESVFLPDRIELTTTTLRDGDPRCCPTGETRWAIDRTTRTGRLLWQR